MKLEADDKIKNSFSWDDAILQFNVCFTVVLLLYLNILND